jgi:hypothetical protein
VRASRAPIAGARRIIYVQHMQLTEWLQGVDLGTHVGLPD